MTTLTGKDVIQHAISDIEGLFKTSARVKIKIELNANQREHIMFSGSSSETGATTNNARIRFSQDVCAMPIFSADDAMFLLVIICHEVAHYLNKHHRHIDDNDKAVSDGKTIETWADFFGGLILMTIITSGKKTHTMLNKLGVDNDQNKMLESLGLAISRVYQAIYIPNISKHYLPPIQRVSVLLSSFTSFFKRLFNKFDPSWDAYVLTTILGHADLMDAYIQQEADFNELKVIRDQSISIHQTIQQQATAVTQGLKPKFEPILRTNYINPPSVKEYKAQLMEQAPEFAEQISKLGIPDG